MSASSLKELTQRVRSDLKVTPLVHSSPCAVRAPPPPALRRTLPAGCEPLLPPAPRETGEHPRKPEEKQPTTKDNARTEERVTLLQRILGHFLDTDYSNNNCMD